MTRNLGDDFEYDVALSFAGEDRKYVDSVAACLKERRVKVFYDKYERVELWGKDLYTHLDDIYRKKARYCVIFISRSYKEKLWSNHERESAQARAFQENEEYILPVRFDDTEIPGIRPTIGYISLKDYSPSEFADLICKKVGLSLFEKFIPPNPSKLFELLEAKTKKEKTEVRLVADHLLDELSLMNDEELRFIYALFLQGCPTGLPDNIHMNLKHFERLLSSTREQIGKTAADLEAFGFSAAVIEDKSSSWSGRKKMGKQQLIEMKVYDRSVNGPEFNNVTGVLAAMIDLLGEQCCDECAQKAFLRLDFSALSKEKVAS